MMIMVMMIDDDHGGVGDDDGYILQLGCGHGLPGIYACLKVKNDHCLSAQSTR